MPDVSLLNPIVLRGVIEKLIAPESMILLNRVPQTPWPYPSMTWDVLTGSRTLASPNVPNSEAHVVNPLGRKQQSASPIYLREKKVFSPTTLHWLRAPGQLAQQRAEEAVMREVTDLNNRFDSFAEFILWQALSGSISVTNNDVVTTVDYQFPGSHLASAGTAWDTATPDQIVTDIRTIKRLIARDGRVAAKDAFSTEATIAKIFSSFVAIGTDSGNVNAGELLSDRMKDQYYANGVIPGFMGLDWNICESVYEDANGDLQLYLADDSVVIGNLTEGRPIEMMIGPSADDEAPDNYTGKFSKTWKEKDPSQRQILLEWNILPVISRPEQLAVLDVS